MDNNDNNNQIENANQNQNENEMKNLEKKVTKNLIKDYSNLLNGNSFTDFSIFVENGSNTFEFKVHKSILSSRSPFFNESLKGQNDIDKIFLNNFNKKEMESILKYIYYGNISFENQENLIQLLEISIYFKLNLLKEIIQKKILNSINYSNFFQFLFQNRNLNSNEIEIKYSISKQDFDKLKQFDIFLPKSFLINLERTIFQIQDKENQQKINEKEKKIKRREKKIKRRDKRIKSFESENDKKRKEILDLKLQNEKKDEEIHNLQLSFQKELENTKQEMEEKWKEEIEEIKQGFELMEFQKIFSDSEIITEIKYVKKLQEWINDSSFCYKMKKGFSAKKNGFDSKTWHNICDDKGKTLVIIKTKDNFIFGGFTQVGWTNDKSKWSKMNPHNSEGGWIQDPNAFIFSLRNDKGDRKEDLFPTQQGKQKYAIFYFYDYGPAFGCDFVVNSKLQSGNSNFGYNYNLPDGIKFKSKEANSYLAGSENSWIVDELETYFI
ncbi:pep-cterm sorting domain-containing protein [Anaeramoeba ignava]|uniref:Pep-cterm sorting domain-containing protein n=1 Tax=Anaeramoeba ignava TaxID=1746090 RepID=A0A9Q0LQ45_ANAIG|nr:pep-cterm sorting domain-containing protein [Anaeramoeba ignava]